MKLNKTKASINVNAKKSNNIEFYVDSIYLASPGVLRGTFIYLLVQKKDAFCSLLSKMQENELVWMTHKRKIAYFTGTLCTLSIIISLSSPSWDWTEFTSTYGKHPVGHLRMYSFSTSTI